MSNFANTLYLQILRPAAKTIKHFFTGETQIERVSKEHNLQSLEYSLRESKRLIAYKDHHPYATEWTPDQAAELMAIKSITNEHNKFHVKKSLCQLHSWRYALYFLEKRRSTAYSSSVEANEVKLLQIWANLKPSEKLTNRISTQWIGIGFQADDPATDFRGSGCLGLDNLHAFSSKNKCKRIYSTALDPKTQYFFSSASIFLTMLALDLVKMKVIPIEFWVKDPSSASVSTKFQQVYEMVFHKFDQFWAKVEDKSMMQFNVNLLKFAREMKRSSSEDIKRAFARACIES